MIIIAWNGTGPSSVFDGNVFKKVLSIFITAAILKLGQGMFASFLNLDDYNLLYGRIFVISSSN